ncbi:MAG TPA: hypothetical protein VHS27_14075 [Gaiellales bacterium]|nr:hypothetical protein [Gaiellales bacterium]
MAILGELIECRTASVDLPRGGGLVAGAHVVVDLRCGVRVLAHSAFVVRHSLRSVGSVTLPA